MWIGAQLCIPDNDNFIVTITAEKLDELEMLRIKLIGGGVIAVIDTRP